MSICLARRSVKLAALAVLLTAAAGGAASSEEPERSITQVSGDLYRFQNNYHHSVFLVTPEGVIVTDPINAEAATWLTEEIDRRFGLPIKYLIYSHDHVDHSAGGEVFADAGAIVVAHENAKRTIIRKQWPTAVPDITFSDAMTIELGGKMVELSYPGRSHSDNLIIMHFPDERAVFVADLVSVRRLPYKTLDDGYFPDWIDAIRRLETIDFSVLVPGHGMMGTKTDASNHRAYLEELYQAVLDAERTGQSLADMKAGILLDDYKDWIQYDEWRELNVEGMYNNVNDDTLVD